MVPNNVQEASDERRNGRGRRGTEQLDLDTDTSHNNQLVEDVLPAQSATTKTGNPRQRLAWTLKMNTDVMRCFYKCTKLETIKTRYRGEMHELFLSAYPQLANKISEQRLMDQKRSILINKLLTDFQIQEIKQEIAMELNNNNEQANNGNIIEEMTGNSNNCNTPTPLQNSENNHHSCENMNNETQAYSSVIDSGRENNGNEILKNTMMDDIETNITKWKGTEPSKRQQIPKLQYNKNNRTLLDTMNNQILPTLINRITTLTDFQLITYAAASTIITCNNQNKTLLKNSNKKNFKPKWRIRLENKINTLRKEIGRLTQYNVGNRSKHIQKQIQIIKQKYAQTRETTTEINETLKQKLRLYAARLRRYTESNERKTQNKIFTQNEKQFYRKLQQSDNPVINPPTQDEITEYWGSIWSAPVQHNHNSHWIQEEKRRNQNLTPQGEFIITIDNLKTTINNTHNWKCPGNDFIHNFWYKKFTALHHHLLILINEAIAHPERLPTFLTEGKTFIKPKNNETNNPANYRPITCLPTLYKIITSVITNSIYDHLIEQNILTDEQKGCRKNSRGCKEQLIMDSVVLQQAFKEHRNLHTCFVDYKKAFDSVPHSWLLEVLEIYKIHPDIRNFLSETMKTWRTTINLQTNTTYITTNPINIERGIFQGDSLSALWFCMCLNPLSNVLKNTSHGFKIKHQKTTQHTINHLLYMDDIKLYATTNTQLQNLIKIVQKVTDDMRMEFGISKCKTQHVSKGIWTDENTGITIKNDNLENLESHETYKYLGFQQNTRINHTDIKRELINNYKRRLNQILRTYLNSRNLFKAINTYAIAILTYSFGIIKWTKTDLENLEILTRSHLTKFRKHHPKSCIQRITLSRQEGGRGLIDIQQLHNKQIMKLRTYFHQNNNQLHQAIVVADNQYTPLCLNNPSIQYNTHTTEDKKTQWRQKELHGRHPNTMQDNNIDKLKSYTWLTKGELQPETEGFIIAIQDQVIQTKNYLKYIVKDPNTQSDKCRKCNIQPETIQHITNGCQILAGTQYTERHNIVAKIIHQSLAKINKLIEKETPYYKYNPETVLEDNSTKILWDKTLHTDKTIMSNRPDITIIDKIQKITYFIEISVPNDNNIHTKYTEKLEKYHQLAQEIKRIWKQNEVKTIPFIISSSGIIHKSFIPNLKQLTIEQATHHNIQKAVILKTCNIVRNFLNI